MHQKVQKVTSSLPFTRQIQLTFAASAEVREVVVHIGLPERDPVPGGDFRVLVEITGFDEPYTSLIHGVDELHAFLSGCWLVTGILPALVPSGARLTWLGDEDLGFGTSR
jgi:hypothetical protein